MTGCPDFDRAATMAYRCLLRLGVCTLPVHPADVLRRCRETVVYTYRQAAEHLDMTESSFEAQYGHADAFTIRQGTRYIVCYREDGNPARRNFTLAHELGHIVMKHAHGSATEEDEANCFASHLLCPAFAVEGMPADDVARACYISRTAANRIMEQRRGEPAPEIAEALRKAFANENAMHEA